MYARQMEAFAAQLEHVDHEIGRIIAALERTGMLENTLIMVTSDNGASGEGGLEGTHNEMLVLNGIAKTPLEENQKRYDQWGSGRDRQSLPRRLGDGGQHAVPVLQADQCTTAAPPTR